MPSVRVLSGRQSAASAPKAALLLAHCRAGCGDARPGEPSSRRRRDARARPAGAFTAGLLMRARTCTRSLRAGLRRLAEYAQALVFERTPACGARKEPATILTTAGRVRRAPFVLGTNAYSRRSAARARSRAFTSPFSRRPSAEPLAGRRLRGARASHCAREARELPPDRRSRSSAAQDVSYGSTAARFRRPGDLPFMRAFATRFPALGSPPLRQPLGRPIHSGVDFLPSFGVWAVPSTSITLRLSGTGSRWRASGHDDRDLLLGPTARGARCWTPKVPLPPEPLRWLSRGARGRVRCDHRRVYRWCGHDRPLPASRARGRHLARRAGSAPALLPTSRRRIMWSRPAARVPSFLRARWAPSTVRRTTLPRPAASARDCRAR